MSEYFITKRDVCGRCNGTGNHTFVDKNLISISSNDLTPRSSQVTISCNQCADGYIETSVDLLDVLKKVRWTEIGDVITKDGYEKGVVTLNFNNVRIEENE